MSRSCSEKTHNNIVLRFGTAVQKLSALVVLVALCMLPAAPVFANEDGEPTQVNEQASEAETEIEILEDEATVSEEASHDPEEVLESDAQTQDEPVNTEPVPAQVEDSTDGLSMPDDSSVDADTLTEAEDLSDVDEFENEIAGTSSLAVQEGAAATTTEDEQQIAQSATTTADQGVFDSESATTTTSTSSEESIVSVSDPSEVDSTTDLNGDPSEQTALYTTEEDQTSGEPSDLTATSPSDDSAPANEPVSRNIAINDMNRYQFSVDECMSMGDGSFYCTDTETDDAVPLSDAVYAKLDAEGDREIFVAVDGNVRQITDNQTDDDAPFYDEISNTIVWHRLLDGRYQIFEYSMEDETERQLTTERYNNMQPSRYGDTTVWQGWVGSDWEILLEKDGELSMLTDNTVHDISPHIRAEHVIWQSFEDEVWKVKVYNTETGVIDTIADDGGGSVENPRFVLIYDAKSDNGDIETRGYDLSSGDIVPLSSTPAPAPQELPDPDPTDEERALLTTVTAIKPKSEGPSNQDSGPSPDIDPATNDHGTSTTDIIIPPLQDGSASSTEETTDAIGEAVIPKEVEDSAEKISITDDIEDVVVVPFEGTISTSTDSQ